MLTCSGSLMLVGEGSTARDADHRHWPYLLWIRCSVIGPLEQAGRATLKMGDSIARSDVAAWLLAEAADESASRRAIAIAG